MHLGKNSFFIHNKFKDGKSDYASGHDIALISIEKDQYSRLEKYIYYNEL